MVVYSELYHNVVCISQTCWRRTVLFARIHRRETTTFSMPCWLVPLQKRNVCMTQEKGFGVLVVGVGGGVGVCLQILQFVVHIQLCSGLVHCNGEDNKQTITMKSWIIHFPACVYYYMKETIVWWKTNTYVRMPS